MPPHERMPASRLGARLRQALLALAVSTSAVATAGHEPFAMVREGTLRTPVQQQDDPVLEIASGRFFGGGRSGLAVISDRGQSVLIYPRAGGAWSSPEVHRIPLPVDASRFGYGVGGMAAGDINNDGVDDLFLWTVAGYRILMSAPGGARHWIQGPTGYIQQASAPVLADFDRDGNLDFLVYGKPAPMDAAAADIAGIRLHFGDGTGGTREVAEIPTGPRHMVDMRAVDMNDDGLLDLVSLESTGSVADSGILNIRYGTGGGGFEHPRALSEPGALHDAFAIGDFNGDGRPDLATDSGRPSLWRYQVLLQTADGRLVEDRSFRRVAFNQGKAMIAADLDGDGKDDLVIAHTGWSFISYFLQRSGGLDEVQTVQSSEYASPDSVSKRALAFADFKGDGDPQLVLASHNRGFTTFLRQSRPYTGAARPPGPPILRSAEAIPDAAAARITFSSPADDGGAPVLAYRIEMDPPGGRYQTPPQGGGHLPNAVMEALAFDLEDGVPHRFYVRARNEAGWGERSTPSAVVTPYTRPILRVDDAQVEEGNSGKRELVFTFDAQHPARPGGLVFDIATVDGTATAGEDYRAVDIKDARIPEGGRHLAVPVEIYGDTEVESTEHFLIVATNIRGGNPARDRAIAQGFILNDDHEPSQTFLSVEPARTVEGDSGLRAMRFRVALAKPLPYPVYFRIEARAIDRIYGIDPATPGVDFVPRSLERAVMPAGETEFHFDVQVVGDLDIEQDEAFEVRIDNVGGQPRASPRPWAPS